MSFIKDLSRKMANITKEEPIEEEYYILPKFNKYITALNKYNLLFNLNKKNISTYYVTKFLWNVNVIALSYKRLAEDYKNYTAQGLTEDDAIMKDILNCKKKVQAKFRKIYTNFENALKNSDIKANSVLERMDSAFDFDDAKWNEIVNEPTRTYLASNPLHGRNQ